MKAYISPALRQYLATPDGRKDLTKLVNTGQSSRLSFVSIPHKK